MNRPRRDHSHRRWQRDPLPPPSSSPRRRGSGPWLPWLVIVLLGIIVYLLAKGSPLRQDTADMIVGQAAITDGDTLKINGHRIRLHGIDAPESDQTCTYKAGGKWRCGHHATVALERKISWSSVSCRQTDIDRYGRIVAICKVDGEDLNSWMVRQGWAVAYTRYSMRYLPDQVIAWFAGRGIWAGNFTMPEDWRHQRK